MDYRKVGAWAVANAVGQELYDTLKQECDAAYNRTHRTVWIKAVRDGAQPNTFIRKVMAGTNVFSTVSLDLNDLAIRAEREWRYE